jgi:hypothetical protein
MRVIRGRSLAMLQPGKKENYPIRAIRVIRGRPLTLLRPPKEESQAPLGGAVDRAQPEN